jgi:hypothetical protein
MREGRPQMKPWEDPKWIEKNICVDCGKVITNRWTAHKTYGECEKQLNKGGK